MVKITEETVINAKAENVWKFLTTLPEGDNYKRWHPVDHIKMICLKGHGETLGSQFYFEEHIGKVILRLTYQLTVVEDNKYLEYSATFPLSLLRLGKASFRITGLDNQKVKLTAFLEYGYEFPIIGRVIDSLIEMFFKRKSVKKHMHEEGENIKKILEI